MSHDPMSLVDAWVIARLLSSLPLNGELEKGSKRFRGVATQLNDLAQELRGPAWEGFLNGQEYREEIIQTVADTDPTGPMPESLPPGPDNWRPANLSDLRRVSAEARWVWPGFIPANTLSGIAAFEGVGKTRFAMDLAA